MKDCKHKKLHTGSGGFYIICSECGIMWVAKKPNGGRDDDFDYSRNNWGSRAWLDESINQEGSLKDWKEKFNSEMQEKFESWCYRHTGLDRHEIDRIIEYFEENVIAPLQNKKVPKDWDEIKRLIIEFMGEEFYNEAIAPLLEPKKQKTNYDLPISKPGVLP